MTINKAEGQSLKVVGIHLHTPVFTHGQRYVAVSRITDYRQIYISLPLLSDGTLTTDNIVELGSSFSIRGKNLKLPGLSRVIFMTYNAPGCVLFSQALSANSRTMIIRCEELCTFMTVYKLTCWTRRGATPSDPSHRGRIGLLIKLWQNMRKTVTGIQAKPR
jgi:hypothetical protein